MAYVLSRTTTLPCPTPTDSQRSQSNLKAMPVTPEYPSSETRPQSGTEEPKNGSTDALRRGRKPVSGRSLWLWLRSRRCLTGTWGFNLGVNVGRLTLRRVRTRQNACVGMREWWTDGSIVDVRFSTMVLSFFLVRSNGVSGGKVFPPLIPVWWSHSWWGFWFSRDTRSVTFVVRTSKALHDAVNAGVIEGVTLVTTGLTPGVMLVVVANVR